MINIIVACDKNNLIGRNGKLPWNIKEDWEYFLKETHDGVLIMGRKCYMEFEEQAKNRKVIALSRNPNTKFAHAQKAKSLTQALFLAGKLNRTVWICGGRAIYEEALPLANHLYITEIDAEFCGDIYLPPWQDYFKKEISRKSIETHSCKLTFRVLSK
jgi:dihydrofolate reductase